jgi:tRNA (guanine37-N1)-methyltransferase
MTSSQGIKVPKGLGERFRRSLIGLELLDTHRRVRSDEESVYLPVLNLPEKDLDTLRNLGEFLPVFMEFQEDKRRLTPEDLLGFSPSFEVVGDIAMVAEEGAPKVADALMRLYKNIRVVITPVSEVEGEFRTRRFRHVAGEERTVTVHKEHGLKYKVDLQGAYFSPRLGTERLRVAKQVTSGQRVLDMFAGVGPFALLLAKREAKVIAIDKNPVAVRYLRENAQANKISDVEILEGDAAQLALRFQDVDHVIMNLPHSASSFLVPAITAAKDGATIHYYAIAPEDNLFRDLREIALAFQNKGFSYQVLHQGVVRSYAPHWYHVVIDLQVTKK